MPRILTHIVEQHAEEAAFLWLLRDKAVDAPHYKRHHLARLDERVEAHVDGLRVAGEAGREIAWSQLQQWGQMGELFAAAVVVVEDGDPGRVAPCVEFAEKHPETLRGLVGALAWTEPGRLGSLILPWLDSGRPLERYLGVAACSVHRVDPQSRLSQLVEDKEPIVQARALRLVGEVGRTDLTNQLARAMDSDVDATARFWAAWSLTLLTDSLRAVAELQRIALDPVPEAGKAFDLALRALPVDNAKAWLSALNDDPTRARQVVVGLGVIGDPAAVPWLIEKMRESELARVAGESFSIITGVDLPYLSIDRERPQGHPAILPDEDLGTSVDPDPDEHLPWPNLPSVMAWWQANADHLSPRTRHLLGDPISSAVCEGVWRDGYQCQRRFAAYELAMERTEESLRNWRRKVVVVAI